ncbi:MAG: hypothetical protein ABIR68_14585 [Ilumatobacteraceae bacterium]
MLGRIPLWRHLAVAASIVFCAVLAFVGVVGAGNRDERFDAKQVVVQPAGADGVRITEFVDEDFGSNDRHGYERIIPNDFGAPTDIVASSPDANADINLASGFDANGVLATVVRLGDPNSTVSGQHRYQLAYTLPNARLSTGALALDIIAAGEALETLRFTVIVDGMQLQSPTCNVGAGNASGGCTLAADGAHLRTVIAPLPAGDGITIGGTVVSRDPNVAEPVAPPIPQRRPNHRVALGLAMLPVGALSAGLVFFFVRRAGRNEVGAGGAADAAYAVPGSSTRLVADDRMAALATVEFVPPKDIEPWQGAVLLTEQINAATVSAWFSGLIAHEVLTLDDTGPKPILAFGPHADRAHPATAALLHPVLADGAVTLGKYDPAFASMWRKINAGQVKEIAASGWWRKRPPGTGLGGVGGRNIFGLVVVLLIFGGSTVAAVAKGLTTIPLAIVLAAALPVLVALGMYWFLLRSRSAVGSGLAIRTESFRKFLEASEGRHVEWAWKQGLLREYSAWAVALGAADAWSRALATSTVPPSELSVGNPLLVYSLASAFTHTTTAPSSSGGGGGGGFSGGFSGGSVGGGGGGGSSGSW